MNALKLSRLILAAALCLGVFALWAGATPQSMSAKSLEGGWDLYQGCKRCSHTEEDCCSNAEHPPLDCDPGYLEILIVPGPYWGGPFAGKSDCTGEDEECNNLYHSVCYNGGGPT